ncbi:hypothetical protein DQ04_01291020 [Trypanosoma grayi]|uniref:hypothetical protein n=1 Tax=Trypanosoma grayi TaxID=71804 RepID=UPI0004F45599|nr:hypothetical protein DQ04_01291020 [Trypanosoma grayi]KEG12972.1 hypothetical protein DQ04_01291020 [Trypanosoma grayi]
MMAFTTTAVAQSLVSTVNANNNLGLANQGTWTQKSPQQQLCPEEETLFKTFRQEFLASRQVQQALLYSFPVGRCGAKNRTSHRCVLLQRRETPPLVGCKDSFFYYINFDQVYTEVDSLFNETHQWWVTATRGLRRNGKGEGVVAVADPEVLLIVLSPTQTMTREISGGMLPSLVRLASDNVNGEESKGSIRVCGFPPRVRFGLSLQQLQQLSLSCPGEPRTTQRSEGDWFFVPSEETVLSQDGCSVVLVSSDFIAHSLFFLEWCVPEDFPWSPRRPKLVGWGCDVLGKLLRGISEHLAADVVGAADEDNNDSVGVTRRRRSEHTDAFVDIVPAAGTLEAMGSVEALDSTRRDDDIHFVKTVCAAASTPRRELAVKALLAHLDMIGEAHMSLELCQWDGAAAGAAERVAHPPLAVELVGRAAQRLKELVDQQRNQISSSSSGSYHNVPTHVGNEGGTKGGPTPLFVEVLQRRFAVGGLRRLSRFYLAKDGEKLLDAPSIGDLGAQGLQDDAAELADVAEVAFELNESARFEGGVGTSSRSPAGRLPRGPLRSILEASFTSYVSSTADVHKRNKGDGVTACRDGPEEFLAEGNGGKHSGIEAIPPVIVGSAFLQCMERLNGDARDRSKHPRYILEEMMEGFWSALAEGLATDKGGGGGVTVGNGGSSSGDGGGASPVNANTPHGRDLMRLRLKRTAGCGGDTAAEVSRGELWLRHVAFLFTHASVSGAALSPLSLPLPVQKTSRTIEEERNLRVVRGLEAHLFFFDAVLCAADSAVLTRWIQAREALEKKNPVKM